MLQNPHSRKIGKRAKVPTQNGPELGINNTTGRGNDNVCSAFSCRMQSLSHLRVVNEKRGNNDEIVRAEIIVDAHNISRDSHFPQALMPGLSGREVPPRICGIFRTNRTDRIVACPLALPVNDNCSAGTHASPRNRRQRL